jgi:protein involved in sex pheromone biosynthesis
MKHRIAITIVASSAAVLALAGCSSQADTVSQNLSQQADSFQVSRDVVFHDDITDTYIAEVEGRCSLGNSDSGGTTSVTCKIGPNKYVKEIFRMGKNTSISSVQTKALPSDPYHYRVTFRPQSVVPNVVTQTSH